MPAEAETPPILNRALSFYLNAFWELGTTRPIPPHGGELPIPWTAIDRYAGRYDMAGEAFDRFITIIRAIEGEYLQQRGKQAAEAKETQKALDAAAKETAGEEKAREMTAAMARKKKPT